MRPLTATAITLLIVSSVTVLRADLVTDWNALMLDGIRADNTNPPLSTRNLAILHTALFDTVNSIEQTHVPYQHQIVPTAEADVEAAISACGHAILSRLHPSVRGRAETLHKEFLDAHMEAPGLEEGLAIGTEIATLMLDSRQGDGSPTDVAYFPSDLPGAWRRTPPYYRPPIAVNWGIVRPFCIEDIEDHMPPPPPSLDSRAYAEAFNEVKEIGGVGSSIRTAEESLIAEFWSDYTATLMPPGHWHEIAATILGDGAFGYAETTRLFALISLAQADAAIVCWEAKYRHNLWRPVTAIWRANEDGNGETFFDPDWDQHIEAPPFPAYPSGHSTLSTTSAEIMTAFFGTDAISFTAWSDSLPGISRDFTSLKACADEVGQSRIFGGIHFSFDNVEGKRIGRTVAARVLQNQLLPIDTLPRLNIWKRPSGTITITAHGTPGRELIVDESEDLRQWSVVRTGMAQPGGITINASDSAPAAFYRVRQN